MWLLKLMLPNPDHMLYSWCKWPGGITASKANLEHAFERSGPVMKAIALKQTLAINTVTPVNCRFLSLSISLSLSLYLSPSLSLSHSLIMILWMEFVCLFWESNKKREVRGCVWDPLVCLLKVVLSSPRHWTTDLCMGLQMDPDVTLKWDALCFILYTNISANIYHDIIKGFWTYYGYGIPWFKRQWSQ